MKRLFRKSSEFDSVMSLRYVSRGENRHVSLYRVHFKWKEKEVELLAKSLDLTHPYFVSIKGLVFPTEQKLVINPSEEETRRTFSKSDHLMIPFQTVSLIEELPDGQDGRVMPFALVENTPEKS
jgi:hypothetical protein